MEIKEIWIRSQDRLHLEKVNYITINGLDIFCEGFILGTYKTQERTLQILDEIQHYLETVIDVSQMVYEMPKE
jgi:hypothetical protein